MILGFSQSSSGASPLARAMANFSRSKSVPVVLAEFGVWGPYVEGGALKSGVSAKDRAAYAQTVYEGTVPFGIGITWWALGDDNTGTNYTLVVPAESGAADTTIHSSTVDDAGTVARGDEQGREARCKPKS